MRKWNIKSPDDSKAETIIEEGKSKTVKHGFWDFLDHENDTWLREWCLDHFEHPKGVIEALLTGSDIKVAAATLFAYCYYAVLWDESLEDQLQTSKKLADIPLRLLDEESGGKKKWPDSALNEWRRQYKWHIWQGKMCLELIALRDSFFLDQIKYGDGREGQLVKPYVEIMLYAVLAMLLTKNENEYDPYIYDVMNNTYRSNILTGAVREAESFSLEKFKCDGEPTFEGVLRFLSCVACATVCYSYAFMESKLKKPEYERDYASAFCSYVRAFGYIEKTGNSIAHVSLPPLVIDGMDENKELLEIIKTWEKVKQKPSTVKDWQEMYDALKELDGYIHILIVVDGFADMVPHEYFQNQLGFCQGNMNSDELRNLLKKEKYEMHMVRMQRDFFAGLWEYFEKDTQEKIISAESKWYDGFGRGGSVKSAIEDYSLAIETELHSIIFINENVRHYIEQILARQKHDPKYRILMNLTSLHADTLSLGDMAKLLRYVNDIENRPDVKPIKDFVEALPISEDKIRLLTDKGFTYFLQNVWSIRSQVTHRRIEGDVVQRISTLRRQTLGIGFLGYLVELGYIKRLLLNSKQRE